VTRVFSDIRIRFSGYSPADFSPYFISRRNKVSAKVAFAFSNQIYHHKLAYSRFLSTLNDIRF